MGVKLLGKIKIHEIAKKLGLASKEVLDVAKKLKIEVKSHLSSLDEGEAKKIEKALTKKEGSKKEEKKRESEKEKDVKKEEKAPVIIRREVIIAQEEPEKKKEVTKKEEKKNQVGFIERKQNKDYNIVYRNKPNKPMTVSELFGLKKEEAKPTETTTVEPEEKVEEKTPIVKTHVEQHKEEKAEKSVPSTPKDMAKTKNMDKSFNQNRDRAKQIY